MTIKNRTRLGEDALEASKTIVAPSRSRTGLIRPTHSGLTLIELMVAIGIGCIVLLSTALILVFGQKSLNHGLQQATLQRDASYAMLKAKQSIRTGTQAVLDADGQGVKIYHTAGWIRFWFVPGQKDLRYQLEGESEQTLLDGVVNVATFEVDSTTHKTVTVGFVLQNGDCEARLSSTTFMRNYSGT
jgi:prepilin-type N-terminal cleavage/methylation domain-containing protein